MMPVEKLRGEAELASHDMKFFELFVVVINPHAHAVTSDDFLPEEQSTVTRLPPWWEVRTKVSCVVLTSVVGISKPTLEESFQVQVDIFISSDEDSKPIVIVSPSQTLSSIVQHRRGKGQGAFPDDDVSFHPTPGGSDKC